MNHQNYKNHVRLDPRYHFVLAPLTAVVLIWAIVHLILSIGSGENIGTAVMLLLMGIVLALLFLLVREYPKQLQDRLIRLEEQSRHIQLTGQPLDAGLSLKQIIALRFAGDEEFPDLCKRALQENWTGDQIKREIKRWRADNHRV